MTDGNDKLPDEFRSIAAGLERLSHAIDDRSFPGRAWPAAQKERPSLRRRHVFWALAVGAAAAAILVLVILSGWFSRGPAKQVPAPLRQLQLASAPAATQPEATWSWSGAVELPPSNQIEMGIPALSIPSAGDGGGIGLEIPSLSLPSPEDWRTDHDS